MSCDCSKGGVERDNLHFEVQTIGTHGKLERVHDLLSDRLGHGHGGCAIVFRATRSDTEVAARYLQGKGWAAAHFHAGLTPPEKKETQDKFAAGDLRVMCATNAFGMGIDKDDVRLVIHADAPGSLENYLQEAGRAGRDGQRAECVLLFDEADCEQQFRLGAMAELSRRDIAQILRGLRKAARPLAPFNGSSASRNPEAPTHPSRRRPLPRRGEGERAERATLGSEADINCQSVVITTGELLRDEDFSANITLEDRAADTKVRAAIAWLERADFLKRDENVTTVFQARPLVKDLTEAEAKMQRLNLPAKEQALWLAILREVMNAAPTDSLKVDELALLPEFAAYAQSGNGNRTAVAQAFASAGHGAFRVPMTNAGLEVLPNPQTRLSAPRSARKLSPEMVSAKIIKVLRSMAETGLMKRDMLLNAFVRHKVSDHSRVRLDRVLHLDRRLVDLMATEEPDPEGWMFVSLRLLNQRLCNEEMASSPDLLVALLKSLREDGRGFAGTHGSIDLRPVSRESWRLRVRRSWTAITELAEKRRRVASVVLEMILQKIPADAPASAERLVDFSFEELRDAVERDATLRANLKDLDAALERALMYLHEQRVIVLQHGLAVFRSAMTIRLQPQAKGAKYTSADYETLAHHYRERILQVHVMSEYARRGLERMREALALALAYFTLNKEEFIRRHLSAKPELLKHATTAQSYQRIVTDLANPAQMRVVTAPVGRNMLILAGPGSGKTKTVVHRCAYLLRVERVRPQSVLVCCFNRQAAIELRRRLADLVGDDARGVTVSTYHGLAMRLLGYAFSGPTVRAAEFNFDALIADAVKLFRGVSVPPGIEPDEVRDRLLAGFQHILVDEYQDIDAPQYEMISALAGRKLSDPDLKLSILAVGDDDQNIYAFRGANVEFIRRFQQDYDAEIHYLVENYRSTRYIIEAANGLIAANADRMKTERPICMDRHRMMLPAGGAFGRRDPTTCGKVSVIRVRGAAAQAEAVVSEIQRLRALGVSDWSKIAVLSRTHSELAQVRIIAESEQIPIRWLAQREAIPPLHEVREVHRFLKRLAGNRHALCHARGLREIAIEMFSEESANPWVNFVNGLVEAWHSESGDAELPVQDALEFLYETCADSRREFCFGDGVTLSTVHAAKGTENNHVLLIGAWPLNGNRQEPEELRRTFYVGMTRARQTLAVFDRNDIRLSLPSTLTGAAVLRREFDAQTNGRKLPQFNFEPLGLEDIYLSYPANFAEGHRVHRALASLRPGSQLKMRQSESGGLGLHDNDDTCVARLSQKAEGDWRNRLRRVHGVRVLAIVRRSAEQEAEADRRARCRVAEWEIPVAEVTFLDGRRAPLNSRHDS